MVIGMIMIVSDLETYTIPDSTQLALLITAIIFNLYNGFDLLYSTFSALIYFAMIFVSSLIVSKWKKKDAIGGADLKLITICGLVLGILALPLFFLFSGLFGIVFGLAWQKIKKNEYFPFGPALIASFLFLIFYLS